MRDEPWLVEYREAFQDTSLLTLRGVGGDNLGETLRVLEPFETVYAGRADAPVRRGTRREALAAVAAAIADAPGWSDSWTAAAARIDLRTWQLEPALTAIRGATRLLLADGVGLGKTIQALLIVAELAARGLVRRVLVLTPASLREQWAAEASQRFGLQATVFDQATLGSVASALPPGVNPWSTARLIVSSIDLVKRGDVRSSVDAVAFDAVIVDEAHHLTPATDRAAVVADLAARTPWLVLLTATPHTGDDAAFRLLCGLGDVSGDGGITAFRRQADEVTVHRRLRRQKTIGIATTRPERALLEETLAYARAISARPSGTQGSALVAGVIARRATSCAAAAPRTLRRRLTLLSSAESPLPQPLLPWDEGDADDGPDDGVLSMAGLDDRGREIAWLERLVSLADAASVHSSKVAFVRRLLRRTRESLIVFSEYRDVVRTVAACIADLSTVAVLHGGLSAAERRQQLGAFADGRARTLVATDAAGEGLNLQARCRLVVSLELPWNPLTLEQRIGRVDRLGQERRVHSIQLLYRESFEEIVAARCDERRSRAAAATSSAGAAASDWPVRSRCLGSVGRQCRSSWSTHAICAAGRPMAPSTATVLVFATPIVDRHHRLVQRHITAVRVELGSSAFHADDSFVDVVRHVARDQRVRAAVAGDVARTIERLHTPVLQASDRYARRVDSLLRAVERERGSRPVQTSLFDRRQEQRAQLRDAAVAGWVGSLKRHRASADAMRSLMPAAPRLVAAWLE